MHFLNAGRSVICSQVFSDGKEENVQGSFKKGLVIYYGLSAWEV